MERMRYSLGALAGLIFLFFIAPVSAQVPAVPDGLLVRVQGDARVYLIEDGAKRWVESAEAFGAQGFRWEDIQTVSVNDLRAYPDGEKISFQTQIIMPGETEVLPDLLMLPPFNFHYATRNGRTILKFSSTFWNAGKGPLELVADPTQAALSGGDTPQDVLQRIVRKDGSERQRLAGIFVWHDPHEHFHFHDFVDFIFEAVDPPDAVPLRQEKTTRCIQDWEPIDLGIAGASSEKGFLKCRKDRQGVSVGWGDLYEYTLADQYLDVHDLAPGVYKLTFKVNPRNFLIEGRTDNNVSFALLYLNVPQKTFEVVEFAAPCWHERHKLFPEEALVRAEGDTKVYVVHSNKKRWLRTEAIFNSYGYAWDKIQLLPKSIVDSIPFNNLIRADGMTVYALNDVGYKRPIRSADIFNSYEFDWNDVAVINAAEFADYADTNLIQRFGDEDIYFIDGDMRRLVKTAEAFNANNFNQEAAHVINEVDFNTYTVGPEITGSILQIL